MSPQQLENEYVCAVLPQWGKAKAGCILKLKFKNWCTVHRSEFSFRFDFNISPFYTAFSSWEYCTVILSHHLYESKRHGMEEQFCSVSDPPAEVVTEVNPEPFTLRDANLSPQWRFTNFPPLFVHTEPNSSGVKAHQCVIHTESPCFP